MIMLRIFTPVPVVVLMVLMPIKTLSVPPPVAVKAVLEPVFKVKLPLKVMVVPVLLSRLIPVPAPRLLMAAEKETVPDVLFWMFTALAVVLEMDVPKLMAAVPPTILTALPEAPDKLPVVTMILPLTLVREMLFVPPVEVTEVKLEVVLPVAKEMAPLLVLMVTICRFNVPKAVPKRAKLAAAPELPSVTPCTVLFWFSVTT